MERISIQLLSPHLWRWILLAIPALCLAFWAYYRILAPMSRPVRGALWVLRGLAFLLVLFALWQPVATVVIPDRGRPNLAVLVDRSASMALPGAVGSAASRAAEGDAVRQRIREQLENRFRFRWYGFNDALETSDADSIAPPSGGTSIGQALEGVLVRAASEPLNGIVLVSDGVNTEGRDPVGIARGSPVPIFTVAVGPNAPLADVEIRRVETNERAFAGEPLPMKVVLASDGLAGRTVHLEVRERGVVRHTEDVVVPTEPGLVQEVDFSLWPSAPGMTLYEVAASVDGDSVPENNVRQVAVEVLARKTRILVVSDALDWDFGFLRRTFDADTALVYSYLVRARPGAFRGYGKERLDGLPRTAAELRDFAAVVLLATGNQGYPATFLDLLGGFAREGGGLFVLGAPRAPREWDAAAAFEPVLPGRLVPDPAPRTRELPVEITAQGAAHPMTTLSESPGETARLLAALPPLWRPRSAMQVSAGAKTLLRYRSQGRELPALAVGFADRGKVAWLDGRGLWRWRLTAAGSGLPERTYSDFLLGVVRWIAEPAIRERFQVQPGKRVYQSGETVTFAATLWDDAYAPVPGARVTLDIRSASDSTAAAPSSPTVDLQAGTETGQYEGRGSELAPGEYLYAARAVDPQSGNELGTAAGRFWVEAMGPEYARSWSDRESLQEIAERSGGTFAEASALPDLIKRIPEAIRRLGRVHEIEVWNHWALFLLFVLVLSTEWFLRRRRGLA